MTPSAGHKLPTRVRKSWNLALQARSCTEDEGTALEDVGHAGTWGGPGAGRGPAEAAPCLRHLQDWAPWAKFRVQGTGEECCVHFPSRQAVRAAAASPSRSVDTGIYVRSHLRPTLFYLRNKTLNEGDRGGLARG